MTPQMTIAEFEGFVDAFGADHSRWPEPRASAAKVLLAGSAEARACLSEARALDRLLASAPLPSADRLAALGDRIAAAAHASPRVAVRNDTPSRPAPKRDAQIVPLPARQPAMRAGNAAAQIAAHRTVAGANWRATAALAASLMLGVTIGSLDLSPVPMHSLFQLSTADHDVEQLVAVLGADGIATHPDEDQL